MHINKGYVKVFSNEIKEIYKNEHNYLYYYIDTSKKEYYLSVLKKSLKTRDIYIKRECSDISRNLSYLIEHIDIHSDFLNMHMVCHFRVHHKFVRIKMHQ